MRETNVVLPAPLQPARPITFILPSEPEPGTGLCITTGCFISAGGQCHATLMIMKIEKTPVPLIVPKPHDPRLTERVAEIDHNGAAVWKSASRSSGRSRYT